MKIKKTRLSAPVLLLAAAVLAAPCWSQPVGGPPPRRGRGPGQCQGGGGQEQGPAQGQGPGGQGPNQGQGHGGQGPNQSQGSGGAGQDQGFGGGADQGSGQNMVPGGGQDQAPVSGGAQNQSASGGQTSGQTRARPCAADIKQFCSSSSGPRAVHDCLTQNLDQLSSRCSKALQSHRPPNAAAH